MCGLMIVCAGAGTLQQVPPAALKAAAEADAVAGDADVLEMFARIAVGKRVLSCADAVREAAGGKNTAVVVSHPGDVAALLLDAERAGVSDMQVIPGVSAVDLAAARLWAPLAGEYAVIRLTGHGARENTERRLEHAFQMGAPVVLCEPKSAEERFALGKAIAVAAKYLSGDTPVGVVRCAFSADEEVFITTLDALGEYDELIDARSVVIVGGEDTRLWIGEDGEVKGMMTGNEGEI